jgi:hypothetical protein
MGCAFHFNIADCDLCPIQYPEFWMREGPTAKPRESTTQNETFGRMQEIAGPERCPNPPPRNAKGGQ